MMSKLERFLIMTDDEREFLKVSQDYNPPFDNHNDYRLFNSLMYHLTYNENAIFIAEDSPRNYTYAKTKQDLADICKVSLYVMNKFLKLGDELNVIRYGGKWFINPVYVVYGEHLPKYVYILFNTFEIRKY